MPSPRILDFNPNGETSAFEKTIASFVNQNASNKESDALADIYEQYKKDGQNIENAIVSLHRNPNVSPTARVNAMKTLTDFQEHNTSLQKQVLQKENNKKIISDLEKRRGLKTGELEAYVDDPKLAEQITRPSKDGKKTQASQPIDEDQLKRIKHIREKPEFKVASPAIKYQLLTDAGVSKENAKTEADIFAADAEVNKERDLVIAKKQGEEDFNFVNDQVKKIPELFNRQKTIDAASALNEEGVTGQLWDQAMQKAGLLQFTSDGYREFASYAKDAVKNQNIKSVIGSQISQMEFGFFRDATISERFSKEANRQILKKEALALRYEKLYADITKNLVEKNEGQISPMIQAQVNDEFALQSQKISQEVKQAARDFEAIQNVPPGKVLMFDKKRRPIHVPANEVQQATLDGASLS